MRLRLQIRIAWLVNVSSHEKPTFGDGGVDGIFVPQLAGRQPTLHRHSVPNFRSPATDRPLFRRMSTQSRSFTSPSATSGPA